jgi:hypothetical protein
MPVAMSRKVEYFVNSLGLDVDIRVFPVVLTQEQVLEYGLPRTPIKETERRRAGFEDRYGVGAVELDALEALYPGTLAAILREHIEQYYDLSLVDRVREAEELVRSDLKTITDGVLGVYEDALEVLKAEHEQLQQSFVTRMEGYTERVKQLWQAIGRELRDQQPDIQDYPVPQPYMANEIGEGLYNSERGYLEQMVAYKEFQGKETGVLV